MLSLVKLLAIFWWLWYFVLLKVPSFFAWRKIWYMIYLRGPSKVNKEKNTTTMTMTPSSLTLLAAVSQQLLWFQPPPCRIIFIDTQRQRQFARQCHRYLHFLCICSEHEYLRFVHLSRPIFITFGPPPQVPNPTTHDDNGRGIESDSGWLVSVFGSSILNILLPKKY